MNNTLERKDLQIARNLYTKIEQNKETFLDLLDNLLDLATFIPVCVTEYGNKEFELYAPSTLIVDEILLLLDDYGYKVN